MGTLKKMMMREKGSNTGGWRGVQEQSVLSELMHRG